jgi:hypothetical protein
MKHNRTITLLLTLFTALGPAAAKADHFHALGTYVETGFENGIAQGTLAGRAAPGGAFTGDFREDVFDDGIVLDGSATLDFGNGDTLTIEYLLVYNSTRGQYLGVWTVQRGTGALQGASGGGEIVVTPNGGQAHLFWLDGDLTR